MCTGGHVWVRSGVYLAGWGFVVGKTASCAAMALTVGFYAWPAHAHEVAVATVAVLTAVNYVGVQKSAWLTRVIVTVVLAVLAVVVFAAFGARDFALPLVSILAGLAVLALGALAYGFRPRTELTSARR